MKFLKNTKVRVIIIIVVCFFALQRYHSLQLFDAVKESDYQKAKSLLRYPWTNVNYKLIPLIDYADYMDWESTSRQPIEYSLSRRTKDGISYELDFEMFTLLAENGAKLSKEDMWFIIASRSPQAVAYCFGRWPKKMRSVDGLLWAVLVNNEEADIAEITSLLFTHGVTFESDYDKQLADSVDDYIKMLLNEATGQDNKALLYLYKRNGAKLPE